MHFNTMLDVELVALESADEVAVLLEVTAPPGVQGPDTRQSRALEIVLDRSGSMSGERLDAAKRALASLIARLDPSDAFGLVAFDDDVTVAVPAAPLADKQAVIRTLATLEPGGSTNLSGGYLRGLQETRRVAGAGAATLLVLSDGHANAGIVEPGALQALAATGRREGVATSTIGLGLDYDEAVLTALASGGAGGSHFALDGDAAGAALAEEVGHLLEQTAQAVSLVIRTTDAVSGFTLWNQLPVNGLADGVMVELGDFHAGEQRRILLGFEVPAMAAVGPAAICELELRWVELATMTERVATVPVNVNVVPGDEAAGRVPEPKVPDELAFLRVQRAKREAAERLSAGDIAAGAPMLRAVAALAEDAGSPELADEARFLRALAEEAESRDVRLAAKAARADWHHKTHRRGR